MKKLILLILLTQILTAQNKRFIYEYKFLPDSANKQNVIKELMFLDVFNKKSLFYSSKTYAEDSTSIAEAKKGRFYIPNIDILYRIEKKDDKTFFLTRGYGLDRIRIEDERQFVWEIQSDKEKIGEYHVQKAETDFAGRKWIAWFTTDIPIQDGPYKFHGLPGLIIKIEDTGKNHSYELVGIKNIKGETAYPELNSKAKETVLNRQKFKEVFREYRRDPASSTKQLYIQGKIPDQTDSSGNFRTGAEIVREVDQLAKERVKKDNNIIELDLLH
ncbi:GLPGLI family protein [Chryseobacterium gossypii]|uniref:GLPGLI family protein n=1 Tax=Chryseobacterium gossypii TaxID=3231602 RepID=UPI003523C7D3